MDVFLTILDVFLSVSGCKNASVGCIYIAVILCIAVLLAKVYTLWQLKYTSRCISAGCKNAMYPKIWFLLTCNKSFNILYRKAVKPLTSKYLGNYSSSKATLKLPNTWHFSLSIRLFFYVVEVNWTYSATC